MVWGIPVFVPVRLFFSGGRQTLYAGGHLFRSETGGFGRGQHRGWRNISAICGKIALPSDDDGLSVGHMADPHSQRSVHYYQRHACGCGRFSFFDHAGGGGFRERVQDASRESFSPWQSAVFAPVFAGLSSAVGDGAFNTAVFGACRTFRLVDGQTCL